MSSKNYKIVRWLLPSVPLVLAVAVVTVVSTQATPVRQSAVSVAAGQEPSVDQATPVPTVAPRVIVNGRPVEVKAGATAQVPVPGGNVTVSGSGQVQVSTDDQPGASTSVQQNGGATNVTVNSNSNGGSSWGSTQVYGFDATINGSSSSFSSTNVFSTGGANVHVTH